MFFLRDPKEQGLIFTNWIEGKDNPVDMFTKNLVRGPFEKCIQAIVGRDEYFLPRVDSGHNES